MESITRMDTRAEVEKFLAVLFEPSDLIEVRAFHRVRGQGVQRFWKPAREIPDLIPRLAFLNQEGEHDIYVGANPRIREGGTEADVAMARCLFADWDDATPDDVREKLAAVGLPEPSLLVHSGHGVHAYWRLSSPVTDMSLWRAAQTALIGKVGSDDKIKDPPRVMRLPGFINLPDPEKDEQAAECVVVSVNAEARYEIAEVIGEIQPVTAPANRPAANPLDQYSCLSRATMQFCLSGAAEGERNQRLFSAACDMAGCGVPENEAELKLAPPAVQCGLSPAEVTAAIRSAYGRPRSPAVTPEPEEIQSALQRMAPTPAPNVVGAENAPAPTRPTPTLRPQISNVLDTLNAEGEAIRYYLPLPQISANIQEATGGWPRRCSGLVFAMRETGDEISSLRNIIWIGDAKELFAWVGHACDIRWASGDAQHHQKKHKLNPPTKDELFAYIKENAAPSYVAVEVLPHSPPMPDVYYLPNKFPPADLLAPSPLKELVLRFNPETEVDRNLILAALITPGWGGPPGARPAFIFTSEHGRGVGKTATAHVLAEIWGGAVTVGAKEDWEVVRKRLLGDESLSKRIILIDNIKGKFHGGDIEGFITARELDGWKPYHGQASRPNTLTWFFTANTPSLSRDLADRSVIIKLGKQQHSEDFVRWSMDFIRQNRPAILAEAYAILESGQRCAIEREERDRWGAWQDAVLTRFDDGNEMAQVIKERRPDVDADNEAAEEIAGSVIALVTEHFFDHDQRRIFITYQQLHQRMLRDGITDKSFGIRQFNTWVREQCGAGPLWFLRPHRRMEGVAARGWLYTGKDVKSVNVALSDIPDITM